jgi:AraC-like DNA-binding protein
LLSVAAPRRVRRSVVCTKLLEPPSRSRYEEHSPSEATASHFACVWTGEVADDGGYTDRILPDACVDIVWDGSRLRVAGPDTGPVIGRSTAGSRTIGVRFRPGHAPAFLGLPASELVDQRVALGDLWGDSVVGALQDELASVAPDVAMRVLERRVAARFHDDDGRSTVTDAVVRLSTDGTNDVDAIAGALGMTTRTLYRHSLRGFGYGAKTLQQVLRFRRFLAAAERKPDATLSQLAADVGYADQSHLARDCNRLSGLAPSSLLVSRGVRSVQDLEW